MYCEIMLKNHLPYGVKHWMTKNYIQTLFLELESIKSYKGDSIKTLDTATFKMIVDKYIN
jgi:hypothetical protein